MKNTVKVFTKKYAFLVAALAAVSGCSIAEQTVQTEDKTMNQVLMAGSPWATTAVYLQVDGNTDKSANLIADSAISKGTISSAQYRKGEFMFIGMSDYTKGTFNEDSLVASLTAVAESDNKPSGFAYGDYEIIRDGEGNTARRITNASFAPSKVIDRTVTVATENEFGYTFTKNGNTYYVEHKPYSAAFSGTAYPGGLQTAVNNLFSAKLTEEKLADYALKAGSPWATTAVYLQVDGKPDTATNLISDSAISKGTISSAQYREGMFMFVGMSDYTTGAFNEAALTSAFAAVVDKGAKPAGFAYGNYAMIKSSEGSSVRRITNASFAPTKTIDRTVTTATENEFTYTFTKNGNTYYVEHKPYAMAFPNTAFPKTLQTAVDKFFTAQ